MDDERVTESGTEPETTVPPSPKKLWHAPKLTVYGTIEDITRNGGFFLPSDAPFGSFVTSDRALKERVEPVKAEEVLERLQALPVSSWRYTGGDPSLPQGRHIGPMAQDFAATFGLGDDETRIQMVDVGGVAFAAIQALAARVVLQAQEIESLRAAVETSRLPSTN